MRRATVWGSTFALLAALAGTYDTYIGAVTYREGSWPEIMLFCAELHLPMRHPSPSAEDVAQTESSLRGSLCCQVRFVQITTGNMK